jgi:hypothetical protein
MATLDGRGLDLTVPGAVLFLTAEARRDWVESLGDGVTAEVREGSGAAVLGGFGAATTLDEVARNARGLVNLALDLMAVRSLGTYSLTDGTSPTITWAGGGATTMRTTSDLHMTFGGTAGGPPNPPPGVWHPSMRYFRLSQTTTDLFDAFRNLYLAIESLLSTVEPMQMKANGRPGEQERDWIERALLTAEQRLCGFNSALTLGRYLEPQSSATGEAAVRAVKADLYAKARTRVFHAKSGRPAALPQHDPDRAVIADALARYARFYTELAEPVLGVRFLTSGLGWGGFDGLVNNFLPQLAITAASTTFSNDEEVKAAPPESVRRMPTSRAPEFDAPFEAALRGTLAAAHIPAGFVVVSVGSVIGDKLASTFDPLGAGLTLEGVDVWEHILTFRAYSHGFKADYSS